MPQPCSLNAAAGPQSVRSICTGQERSISALLAVNKLLTAAVKKSNSKAPDLTVDLRSAVKFMGVRGSLLTWMSHFGIQA